MSKEQTSAPVDPREAKAQAKAAKAYAKAQRPWFKKKRVIIPAVIVVLGIAIAATGSGGSEDSKTPTASTEATKAASSDDAKTADEPVEADGPSATFPQQDGDWRLDNVRLEESFGDFGGTARVTYTGDDTDGGSNLFTITVFKGGTDIATLSGAANDVKPGKTVSVGLISTDSYVKGPFKYDFQNNL